MLSYYKSQCIIGSLCHSSKPSSHTLPPREKILRKVIEGQRPNLSLRVSLRHNFEHAKPGISNPQCIQLKKQIHFSSHSAFCFPLISCDCLEQDSDRWPDRHLMTLTPVVRHRLWQSQSLVSTKGLPACKLHRLQGGLLNCHWGVDCLWSPYRAGKLCYSAFTAPIFLFGAELQINKTCL